MMVALVCTAFLLAGSMCAQAQDTVPTVEQLTGGKVKLGDVIDKTNVDLVKEHLSVGTYECVQRGMKLIMGEHLPLDKLIPAYFREATEKNKGKATIDENGTVYLADGSIWPGGLPFSEPKTALEVMANLKYGQAADDVGFSKQWLSFVNEEGKIYKTFQQYVTYVLMSHRLSCDPLGAYPGCEKENFRRIQSFRSPQDMKGLGQFSIRYYDDTKMIDTGFAYLPAFKRSLRVSSNTWQDNIGGADILYCDAAGVNDPFSYWDYKLIGKKYIFTTATKAPGSENDSSPYSNAEGHFDTKSVTFDGGDKFPRVHWALTPVFVVEGTPRGEHVYGKRVIYVPAPPFWIPWFQTLAMDIYDQQMKIYKAFIPWLGGTLSKDGQNYAQWYGFDMYDLQTGHSSRIFAESAAYNSCANGRNYSLQMLLEGGK